MKITFCAVLLTLPLFLVSAVSLISPTTPTIDPSDNPAFFVFTFLCLNAEWWAYSMGFRNVMGPIVNGVNSTESRGSVRVIRRIMRAAETVPLIDALSKIALFVVPALVGAAVSSSHVLITVFFLQRCYDYGKVSEGWV